MVYSIRAWMSYKVCASVPWRNIPGPDDGVGPVTMDGGR
jgi:hypothetical protein